MVFSYISNNLGIFEFAGNSKSQMHTVFSRMHVGRFGGHGKIEYNEEIGMLSF